MNEGEFVFVAPVMTEEMARAVFDALKADPNEPERFLDNLDRCLAPVVAIRLFVCLEMEWELRGRTWDPQGLVRTEEARKAA